MSHADDLITSRPADDPALGDEEIELEPTIHRAGEAIALREGSLASFAGETDTLRRKRLLAAAVFLAATLGLLCSWVFARRTLIHTRPVTEADWSRSQGPQHTPSRRRFRRRRRGD